MNTSIPFYINNQVFDSCIISSLLYGCETWLTNNLRVIEHVYTRMAKILLGVRYAASTANCLIEIRQKILKTIVNERRKLFLVKKHLSIGDDEPFHIMMQICRLRETTPYRMLMKSLDGDCENGVSPKDISVNKSYQHTKFVIYRSMMNVDFSVHPVYTKYHEFRIINASYSHVFD